MFPFKLNDCLESEEFPEFRRRAFGPHERRSNQEAVGTRRLQPRHIVRRANATLGNARTIGRNAPNLLRQDGRVGVKRAEIAAVHANHLAPETDCAVNLLRRVRLDECRKPEFVGQVPQFAKLGIGQDGRYQEDCIRAHGPGRRDLIRRGVSDYVIAPTTALDVVRSVCGLFSAGEAKAVGRVAAIEFRGSFHLVVVVPSGVQPEAAAISVVVPAAETVPSLGDETAVELAALPLI